MSLSPFDSFQSRFVTYLLNFPHIISKRKQIYLFQFLFGGAGDLQPENPFWTRPYYGVTNVKMSKWYDFKN